MVQAPKSFGSCSTSFTSWVPFAAACYMLRLGAWIWPPALAALAAVRRARRAACAQSLSPPAAASAASGSAARPEPHSAEGSGAGWFGFKSSAPCGFFAEPARPNPSNLLTDSATLLLFWVCVALHVAHHALRT